MKFWQFLAFSEIDQLVALARRAEALGYYGVLLGDHLLHPESLASPYPYTPDGRPGFGPGTQWPDPWVSIGAMAAVTSTLRFATSVYILPLRSPFQVAKSVGTAALLSQGRVALGAGAGWMREEYDLMGVDFDTRGRRYDEMIEVLRKLWGGGMVEHHGEHFDFDRLEVSPTPREPVPIYIGGNSGPALRRAARIGDGWIAAGHLPDEVPAVMRELRRLRREAGRESLSFESFVSVAAMPDHDLFRRLEDAGANSFVCWPFKYSVGPESSVDEKCAVMKRFAETFILNEI